MWKVYSAAAGENLEEQLMVGGERRGVGGEKKMRREGPGEAEGGKTSSASKEVEREAERGRRYINSYEGEHVYLLKYNLSRPS